MSTSLVASASPTHAELPAFLDGFRAIHQAMRRDAVRLQRTARHAGDPRVARQLARWYDRFLVSIEHHHQREDEIVWPMLVDREPDFAQSTSALQHDHEILDTALHAVASALADLVEMRSTDPSPLVAAAHELRGHLEEHLDREEAAAFPLIARSFTADEYEDLEDELRKGLSMSALAFEAPWVLDDMPAARAAELLASVPVPVRVLYHVAFRPKYRRLSGVLEGGSR